MNERKSSLWKYAIALGLLFGFFVGAITVWFFTPVKHVEISPREPEDALAFYVSYLKELNYTVIEKELSTNDFSELEDFKEFLWLLKSANLTECNVDYGETRPGLLTMVTVRLPKLWLQMDGVYWELRFAQ